MSRDDLHLQPCSASASLRAAFPQGSARAVHAIGVRAQAPMDDGAPVWPCPSPAVPDRLTEREMEVLQLLRGSLSRREIATEIGRSLNTIKTQTQAIYRKLGVSTRSAAIARALDTGILPSRGRVEQGELDGEEVVDDVQCLLWGIAALGSSGSPSI